MKFNWIFFLKSNFMLEVFSSSYRENIWRLDNILLVAISILKQEDSNLCR